MFQDHDSSHLCFTRCIASARPKRPSSPPPPRLALFGREKKKKKARKYCASNGGAADGLGAIMSISTV